MAIERVEIDEKSVRLVFTGLITYDELIESYQRVASEEPEYVLLDGQNMMYRMEILFDDYIQNLVKQIVGHPTLKKVIAILPETNPLRETVTKQYEDMGYAHKLEFVDNVELGQALILQLRQNPD